MRSSLSKLFFLIITFLVGFFLYQKLNSRQLVQAEWFNDSWAYRNSLPITSHTAAESGVYITATLNIGSTANTQSDLGDLRLTLQNGQIVPHFLVSGANTTAPVVHIYLKDFPAGAQTLYYYYGHSTVQNGFAVTDFPTQAANYVVDTPGTQEKTQGPLAYWKFDEGSGTTANDYTSERNNLTLSNTTWQNDNMCISGNCLYYNGDSNYASTLSNTKLEFVAADKFTLQTWFRHNSNWRYKTPINITYSSSALTDFQIKFTTDTLALINAGKLRSDCNDLRFYDADTTNNQSLSYWIEGGTCNTTTTIVWVKIPSISGNKTIYMVYGNDQASVGSNGDNVFDAFDDFNGSSIDTNKWSDWNPNSWGTMTVSGGILTINGSASTGGSEYVRAILSQNTFTFSNHVVETKSKRAFTGTMGTSGYYQENGVRISSEAAPTSATSGNQYKFFYQLYNGFANVKGRYDLFSKLTNGTYAEVARFTLSEDNPANYGWLRTNWYSGPNQRGFRSTDNTTYSSTWTGTDALFSLPTTKYFGYYIQSKQTAAPTIAYLDWIRIRKYAATEPTVSVGTETNITLGATSQVLVNKFNTSISNGGYQLSMGTDGNITFAISDSSATFPKDSVATTAGTYGDDNWHFVTAVKDGTASLKLYIDGYLVSTNSTVTSGSLANSQPFYVGSAGDGASNTWQGYIDEVKVYYYARSPSQISADYNTRGSALPKGNAAIIGANRENTQTGFTGPIGYWNMDEAVGSTAFDTSGNNYHANFATGNSSPTWATGKFGKSLYFDGTNEFASVGSTINQINSVSFWVRPTTTSQYFIDFDNGTHYISASSGIITSTGFVTPTILVNGVGTTVITAYTWQHISVTTGTGFTGSNITFGRSTTNFLNGYFDDLRLYNYARTNKQIVEDMNAGHPFGGSPVGSQVAYYKFDEDYGSTAYNTGSGGSSFNGTLGTGTSSPSRTNNGQSAKALSFDGTTDYVSIGSTIATLQTISFWFKPSAITNNKILSLSSTVSIGATSNTLSAPGFSSPTYYVNGLGTSLLTNNVWQHIVISTGSTINANAVVFGKSGTSFFTGLLDEVKIYSGILTANEIKTDYNQGRSTNFGSISQSTGSTAASNSQTQSYCVPGDSTTCAPPIARWDFDEGIGTTTYDKSGNNNHGVWQGTLGNQWKTGKVGKGGNFNGIDNYLDLGDLSSIAQPITISMWSNFTDYDISGKRLLASGNNQIMIDTYNGLRSNAGVSLQATTDDLGPINPGTWYYWTFILDGVNSKIYLNNNLIKSGDAGTNGFASTAWLAMTGPPYYQVPLNGKLDQVRIYNYARTPAQVAWDYNRGQPISWFKLDECQGVVANNSADPAAAGQGSITIGAGGTQTSVGTCAIGPTTAWGLGSTGAFSASVSLDGTDDVITVGATLPIVNTVSLWVKPVSIGTSLLALNATTFLTVSSAGIVTAPGFTTPTIYINGKTNNIVTANRWNHIAVTTATSLNSTAIKIGQVGTSYYRGLVDEIRFYQYPLTSIQVGTLYNQNFAVRFGPPASP